MYGVTYILNLNIYICDKTESDSQDAENKLGVPGGGGMGEGQVRGMGLRDTNYYV